MGTEAWQYLIRIPRVSIGYIRIHFLRAIEFPWALSYILLVLCRAPSRNDFITCSVPCQDLEKSKEFSIPSFPTLSSTMEFHMDLSLQDSGWLTSSLRGLKISGMVRNMGMEALIHCIRYFHWDLSWSQADINRPICPFPKMVIGMGLTQQKLPPQHDYDMDEFKCLNLNITCPKGSRGTGYPVIVWVHG